jgi:hypothetical protein
MTVCRMSCLFCCRVSVVGFAPCMPQQGGCNAWQGMQWVWCRVSCMMHRAKLCPAPSTWAKRASCCVQQVCASCTMHAAMFASCSCCGHVVNQVLSVVMSAITCLLLEWQAPVAVANSRRSVMGMSLVHHARHSQLLCQTSHTCICRRRSHTLQLLPNQVSPMLLGMLTEKRHAAGFAKCQLSLRHRVLQTAWVELVRGVFIAGVWGPGEACLCGWCHSLSLL